MVSRLSVGVPVQAAREISSSLGFRVYGAAAVALGGVGLVAGDFAEPWHPVPTYLPGRQVLAYLAAFCLVAAGLTLQWRRSAKLGLPVLAVFYLVFALRWLARVVGNPQIIGAWLFAEQFALVVAAI